MRRVYKVRESRFLCGTRGLYCFLCLATAVELIAGCSMECREEREDIAHDAYDAAAHVSLAPPAANSRILFIPSSGLAPLSGGERNTALITIAMRAIGFDTMALAANGGGLRLLADNGVRTISYEELSEENFGTQPDRNLLYSCEQYMSQWRDDPFSDVKRQYAIDCFHALDSKRDSEPIKISHILQQPRNGFFAIYARSRVLKYIFETQKIATVFVDSHHDTLAALIATLDSNIKVVAFAQSSDPEPFDGLIARELHIVACSTTSSKRFEGAKSMQVIKNGVNVRKFRPSIAKGCPLKESLGLSCSAKLIGHTGYLGPNKNQKNIVAAAIKSSAFEPQLHVLLVGAALDPLYTQEILNTASGANFSDHLHLLGARKDIADILRELDVFIFPSRQEGFGLSLAEAMASGVPTIANDIPIFRSFVGNAVHLVDTESIETLSVAITQVLSSPSEADKLRRRGPQQVLEQEMTIDSMIGQFAEMFGAVRPPQTKTRTQL